MKFQVMQTNSPGKHSPLSMGSEYMCLPSSVHSTVLGVGMGADGTGPPTPAIFKGREEGGGGLSIPIIWLTRVL